MKKRYRIDRQKPESFLTLPTISMAGHERTGHGHGTIGGAAPCLASAASFGAMGIFGRLAYDDGATVGTLLAVRFALASALFWVLVVASGGVAELRKVAAATSSPALALGGGIYAAQAGGYFAALERVDPSLLALLLYTFPAIVALAAIALGASGPTAAGRPRSASCPAALCSCWRAAARPRAIRWAPRSASPPRSCTASTSSPAKGSRVACRPLVLSALVCTGAAVSLTAGSALLGELRPGGLTLTGWAWIACIAVVCTVAALSLFFAGLRRVGPTTASILSTVEPVVTEALAFFTFGDVLGAAQLLGGLVVLGGVVVLQAPTRLRRR